MSSRTAPRWLAPALAALLLSACSDSDNVSWAFVSNPSGSFGTSGGGVIVIRWSSSSTAGLEGDFLRVDGRDDRGPVTALLPHRGDFGVLSRSGAVEVRSPALSYESGGRAVPGRFEAPGATVELPPPGGPAALRVVLPDSSLVHPGGVGPGTLHVASAGTLMILESLAGLVVFGEREQPEVVGLSATLTTTPSGNEYALLLPDNRVRLLVPPPLPLLEQRLEQVAGRGSVRLFGPTGELLAELPAETVQLQNGAAGVFLTASLPQGLPGDPGPISLLMAADNRYLLRIDG